MKISKKFLVILIICLTLIFIFYSSSVPRFSIKFESLENKYPSDSNKLSKHLSDHEVLLSELRIEEENILKSKMQKKNKLKNFESNKENKENSQKNLSNLDIESHDMNLDKNLNQEKEENEASDQNLNLETEHATVSISFNFKENEDKENTIENIHQDANSIESINIETNNSTETKDHKEELNDNFEENDPIDVSTENIMDKLTKEKIEEKIEKVEEIIEKDSNNIIETKDISKLHLFYYAWYTSPPTDKSYFHWNHRILPHWTQETNNKFPEIGRKYDPSLDEIGSVYYPLLGAYSSNNRKIASKHFSWMKEYGIGTAVLSWWGASGTDGEGLATSETLVDMLFEEADKNGIKIAFHLEPYENRKIEDIKKETTYLIDRYGDHNAMYKVEGKYLKYSQFKAKPVPLFYVYDSYHINADKWESLLSPSGSISIRNTEYDAVYLSLYLSPRESNDLVLKGYFDGIYTYFVSKRFTYGSNPVNWSQLSSFCKDKGLLFSPSIGPGYNDVRVRPWNKQNTEPRNGGAYYQSYFDSVNKLDTKPEFLSITSLNEWHEGTNIEPAIGWSSKKGYSYEEYTNNDPYFYMKLTKSFSDQFSKNKS